MSVDQPPNSELPCYQDDLFNTLLHQQKEKPAQSNLQAQLPNAESECLIASNADDDIYADGNMNYSLSLRRQLFDGEEGLKKVDSFSRWVSKELGEVDNLQMQSSSGISWSTVECGNVVDDSSLSPSLSQDQLFSIIDVSPKWGYADLETEVLNICIIYFDKDKVVKKIVKPLTVSWIELMLLVIKLDRSNIF